jgi:hypothetical protein
MPTYLDALRGVSYTEALLEAAHVAPTSAAVLETFELWHESLAEPIYLVSNTEDFVATKEADADRDAGPANVSVPTLRFRRVEYPTLQP